VQRVERANRHSDAVFGCLALMLALRRGADRARSDLVAEHLLLRHQPAELTRPHADRAGVVRFTVAGGSRVRAELIPPPDAGRPGRRGLTTGPPYLVCGGIPGGIRTPDLLVRSRTGGLP
jgi:hypothetical protein